MITSWRPISRSQPMQQQAVHEPEPGILERMTVEQHANMTKSVGATRTIVDAIIEHLMTPEEQSTLKNYQKTREGSGKQAEVK